MVKIREDLPSTTEGGIDIAAWARRLAGSECVEYVPYLEHAAILSLSCGGVNRQEEAKMWLRQGLLSAEVLISLEPDLETLLAAILYFPAQAGALSLEKIKLETDEEIMQLVSGVMQITAHSLQAKEPDSTGQHDNLRRMLLALVEDVRVVLIKLAERITILRFAATLGDTERRALALETRDIYAPLANRLGIGQIKWELEDLAFRYLEPEAYKNIAQLLHEKRLDRESYIQDVVQQIQAALTNDNIEGEVVGRAKHIYSIWRKMHRKHIDFNDIYDVRAIRILVPEVRDCYAVLGIIHSLWQHIPREFDDYIATPKENGYRSLHTAVIGPQGKTLEVQIRTFQMHQEAELGVAAHWLYKESGRLDPHYQKKLNALRQILEWSQETQDGEANEALFQEVLEDRVYLFTPKGEVIDLPLGATPLDFAYHIHTELGHRCRGAKVNGAIVPLNYVLNSGQQVEILSVKQGEPSRDWLNPSLGYLKSARARSKVHAWFKRQTRDQNILQGRVLLEKELKRLGLETIGLGKIIGKLGLKSLDELYTALGGGDLRLSQVIQALQRVGEPIDEPLLPRAPSKQAKSAITLQGVGNLVYHFAKCCKPVPGDQIVGYITHGRGVTVHRRDCLNVLEHPEEEDRLIQVNWGETEANVYPVEISIRAYDRQGLLRDITSILSNERTNVIAVNTYTNKEDNIANLVLTVEIADLNALMNILNKIMQLPNVIDAQRG